MTRTFTRIARATAMLAIVAGAASAQATYVTGQQYTFSGTAGSYTLSGSFTVGNETSLGSDIFTFSSFHADSGAPGTDTNNGITSSDTVTGAGVFNVYFGLLNGYLPAGANINVGDLVRLSGADTLDYDAEGYYSFTGGETLVDVQKAGTFETTLVKDVTPVPEPDTLALLAIAGLAGVGVARRRRR